MTSQKILPRSMALVEYSDSNSESDRDGISASNLKAQAAQSLPRAPATKKTHTEAIHQAHEGSATQPDLPPLPAEFRDLYSVPTRASVQDDPALHEGRKRAIPHVAGNWPTHLYLEWYPGKSELAALSDVLSRCDATLKGSRTEIHSLLHSDLGAQIPLHISLSRPVVLVTDERHSFYKQFEDSVRASDIRAFDLKIKGLDWVSNFDRTRWFLVLRVNKPANDALNRLLKASNQTLSAFDQPPLYDNSVPAARDDKKRKRRALGPAYRDDQRDFSQCFHISIAWSLNEPSPEDESNIKDVTLENLRDITIHFDSIKVKIGNQILNVGLPSKVYGQSGIAGL